MLKQGFRAGQERGAAILESAFVLLAFFALVMGMMDFGRMVWTYTMIAHGAREATRYAIVRGADSGHAATVAQIQGIVTSYGLDPANTSTAVTFTPDQHTGSTVNVTVTYSFSALAPYLPFGTLSMRSTSQMKIYQ